jgi:hypothetical protein
MMQASRPVIFTAQAVGRANPNRAAGAFDGWPISAFCRSGRSALQSSLQKNSPPFGAQAAGIRRAKLTWARAGVPVALPGAFAARGYGSMTTKTSGHSLLRARYRGSDGEWRRADWTLACASSPRSGLVAGRYPALIFAIYSRMH